MNEIYCQCGACGRESPMIRHEGEWLEPLGWHALNVSYWSDLQHGETRGTLRMRFCPGCVAEAATKAAEGILKTTEIRDGLSSVRK